MLNNKMKSVAMLKEKLRDEIGNELVKKKDGLVMEWYDLLPS